MVNTQLSQILEIILYAVRWGGLIIITIVSMAVLVTQATKSKLSPGTILTVVGSALLAAVLFWILPTLINYARTDADTVLPNHPIGSSY
jgi:uncharacterized membrane protein (DUF373 family)